MDEKNQKNSDMKLSNIQTQNEGKFKQKSQKNSRKCGQNNSDLFGTKDNFNVSRMQTQKRYLATLNWVTKSSYIPQSIKGFLFPTP